MSDPELEAMETVHRVLSELDEAAQERVLRWASDRFGVAQSPTTPKGGPPGAFGGGQDEGREFRDVGELVHAAQPGSGPDYALAVAYWFQEVQERDGWTGADVNNTLKNLGHGLANVTQTLNSLKARKPALVMQVAKSGRSRQARKTYKLTTAGVRTVRDMLAGEHNAEAS